MGYVKKNGAWAALGINAIYRKEDGRWAAFDRSKLDGKRYVCEYLPVVYVSLGDSIAAGHTINAEWSDYYGEGSQYGKNGNKETKIVPGCYTSLIRDELKSRYGVGRVVTKSFARSGDTVADLMEKLDHDIVRETIKDASFVTVCIGANDVLQPAMSHLDEYIDGNMSNMNAIITTNLATLADDTAANSYTSLLNKLYAINPNAKYVFTTVFNPYKYLWLDESTAANDYKDGFLGPLMWVIPDSLGSTLANGIRSALVNASAMKNLFSKVNELHAWSERYVTSLNDVLRSKIAAFGKGNFLLADTKAVFDPVPDRDIDSPINYNDLVNVEVTRGFNVEKLDWGEFWSNYNWLTVMDGIEAIADEAVDVIVNEVIVPDVDPHPESDGHYALKQSFAEALGWLTMPRRTITYNAGTYGAGSMAAQTVVALDNMTAYANIAANVFASNTAGYRFTGWQDSNGAAYSNGQFIGLSGDLTLTAQWSNTFTVAYCKISNNEYVSPSGETGPVTKDGSEYYLKATLGGAVLPGLRDAFGSDGTTEVRTMTVPYGTELYIQLINTGSWDRGKVYLNNTVVAGDAEYCYYTTQITGDTAITFTWEYEQGWDGIIPAPQSYWIARIYA